MQKQIKSMEKHVKSMADIVLGGVLGVLGGQDANMVRGIGFCRPILGPKMAQGGPKLGPNRPNLAQVGPKLDQVGPKPPQEGARVLAVAGLLRALGLVLVALTPQDPPR